MNAETNGMSQVPMNLPAPAEAADSGIPISESSAESRARERVLFTPPIDIYETEEGLVLIADLPGVSVKTLDLQVQDNKLTLLGRAPSTVPNGARLLHREYEEGEIG